MTESERALLTFEQLFDTSRAIYKKQKMILEIVLEPFQITVLQYLLMFKIHNSGSTALSRLALTLDLKPASVTRMTELLCKRHLMVRYDSPDDRRIVMIQLTDEGEDLLQQAAIQYARKAASLYRQLDADHLQYLGKLAGNLSKLAEGCAKKS
ncbi:MarR family transcriptional regulator [Bacillus atrophaeus]|uniref:MarR family transcriptional regulator n=1 Tax=Bacillus atrophaeus TaxID=1452 RepID=UPI00227F3700|nr:MarR family transcriptional regulator [Bacillus atrophaeus]MCY8496763.1 MarR family transcriptional regulator [Bacillus atrophaeus]MCY8813985.1 MarR family transcriptional regulator [Bacillus atrophaeus]MCY8821814.1 MarR family transcriptional regulator [Bacillus atrophaeus]MCY8829266.1 MarR family transcriptional regulator [Bacillus atrophaeus]MCY8834581.1 MarR family transcriptional regulator [Bacillus atrophaeus]